MMNIKKKGQKWATTQELVRWLKSPTKDIIGVTEERREMIEQKNTLEGIMARNLPNLMKDTKLQIQKPQ